MLGNFRIICVRLGEARYQIISRDPKEQDKSVANWFQNSSNGICIVV